MVCVRLCCTRCTLLVCLRQEAERETRSDMAGGRERDSQWHGRYQLPSQAPPNSGTQSQLALRIQIQTGLPPYRQQHVRLIFSRCTIPEWSESGLGAWNRIQKRESLTDRCRIPGRTCVRYRPFSLDITPGDKKTPNWYKKPSLSRESGR